MELKPYRLRTARGPLPCADAVQHSTFRRQAQTHTSGVDGPDTSHPATGPVAGILIGSFSRVPAAVGYADDTAELAPTATITLDADETRYLLAPVADREQADHADCRAETADGNSATIEYAPASELNTRAHGQQYESFARITAHENADYTIECDNDISVITAPPFQLASFFGPFTWWTGGGVAVSLVGIVLTIIGIVRLARHR